MQKYCRREGKSVPKQLNFGCAAPVVRGVVLSTDRLMVIEQTSVLAVVEWIVASDNARVMGGNCLRQLHSLSAC